MRLRMVNMRQVFFGVMTAIALMVGRVVATPVVISSNTTIDSMYLTTNPAILSDGFTVANNATVIWSATDYLSVTRDINVDGTLVVNGDLYVNKGIFISSDGSLQINSGKSLLFTTSYNSGNGDGATLYKMGVIQNDGVIAVPSGTIAYSGNVYRLSSLQSAGIGTVVPYIKNGETIGDQGSFTPAQCVNGFVVAPDASVTINDDVTLNAYKTITISAGANLVVLADKVLTTVIASSIYNYGTLTIEVDAVLASGGALYNNPGATLRNSGTVTLTNTFANYATVNNSGTINNSEGIFNNYTPGIVYNSGIWNDAANFTNNSGALFINTANTAKLDRHANDAHFRNDGTIALAVGSAYVPYESDQVSVVAGGFAAAASALNRLAVNSASGGAVVPYLLNSQIIGETVAYNPGENVNDCASGFIVVPGAKVAVSSEVLTDFTFPGYSTVTIGYGAVLEINAATEGSYKFVVDTNAIAQNQGLIVNHRILDLNNSSADMGLIASDGQLPSVTAGGHRALTQMRFITENTFITSGTTGAGVLNSNDAAAGFAIKDGITVTVAADVNMTGSVVIGGGTLVVNSGKTLVIPSGMTLHIGAGTLTNNGTIALAAGAKYQIGTSDSVTVSRSNFGGAATAIEGKVVPYMVNGDTVASESTFSPENCANGFIVASGTVTVSDDVTTNYQNDASSIRILTGATLVISADFNLTTATELTNDGTIIIEGSGLLMGTKTWVNNGTIITKNSGAFYNSGVANNGTIAMENGSRWFYANNEQVTVPSGSFVSYVTNGANAVPYLTDDAVVGGTNATNTAADCAGGFVVAGSGDVVTINDDVSVQPGGIVMIRDGGILRIATGKTVTMLVGYDDNGNVQTPSLLSNAGTIGNRNNPSYNGVLALDFGTLFTSHGASVPSVNSQNGVGNGNFTACNSATGMNTNVVPRMTSGLVVPDNVAVNDCTRGFIVAAGTVTMSNEVSLDASAVARIASGAHLVLSESLTIPAGATLQNDGHLYIGNYASVANSGTLTNNGVVEVGVGNVANNSGSTFNNATGSLLFFESGFASLRGIAGATVNNDGTIAFATGASYVNEEDDENPVTAAAGSFSEEGNFVGVLPGSVVPFLRSGNAIGSNDMWRAADCADGFVVQGYAEGSVAASSISLNDDVEVQSGGHVIIPENALVIKLEHTLTIADGAYLNGRLVRKAPLLGDGVVIGGNGVNDVSAADCVDGFTVAENAQVTVASDVTITSGSVTIGSGATLILNKSLNHNDYPLTNDGTISIEDGGTLSGTNQTNHGFIINKAGGSFWNNYVITNDGIFALQNGSTFTLGNFSSHTVVTGEFTQPASNEQQSYYDAGRVIPYLADGTKVGGTGADYSGADCAKGFCIAPGASVTFAEDVIVAADGMVVLPEDAVGSGSGAIRFTSGVSLNGVQVSSDCVLVFRGDGRSVIIPYLSGTVAIGTGDGEVDPASCANGFTIAPGATVIITADVKVVVGGVVSVGGGASVIVSEGKKLTIEDGAIVNNGAGTSWDISHGIFVSSPDVLAALLDSSMEQSPGLWNPSLGDGAIIQGSIADSCAMGFEIATNAHVTIADSFTINDEGTVIISDGATLTINTGKTLTNFGYMHIEADGTLENKGFFENVGVVQNSGILDTRGAEFDNAQNARLVQDISDAQILVDNEATVQNDGVMALRISSKINDVVVDSAFFSDKSYAALLSDTNVVPYLRDGDAIVSDGPLLPAVRVRGFVVASGASISIETAIAIPDGGVVIVLANASVDGLANLTLEAGATLNDSTATRRSRVIFSGSEYQLVPYLEGVVTIGGAGENDIDVDACSDGFVIAPDAIVTVSVDMTVDHERSVIVSNGSTLIIAAPATVTNKGELFNYGTIAVAKGAMLINAVDGTIVNDGSWDNQGTIVFAFGSQVFGATVIADLFTGDVFSFTPGGVVVPAISSAGDSSNLIGGTQAGALPEVTAAKGFEVAAGVTAEIDGNVDVTSGIVRVAPDATLVIRDGNTLKIGRDVTVDIRGLIVLEGTGSILYLNDCTVASKGASVIGHVDRSVRLGKGDMRRGTTRVNRSTQPVGTVIFENDVYLTNKDADGKVNTTDLAAALEIGRSDAPVHVIYRNGARVLISGCVKIWPAA